MILSEKKKQLIEEIGVRIEERLSLSPLAARIFALLTLSSYEGLTFEEIRRAIEASKSSTSVNIKVLMQLEYLKYYTKPGDRKRYFIIAKHFQLESLKLYHQSIQREIEMVEKINDYNKEFHPEKFSYEKSVGNITQDYLRKTQNLVNEVFQALTKFRKGEETSI
ncbi:MarR family transcriptional regulator [Bizionia argentinensis JUB59]|uniref:MarR family transcriptional regulator n=1 Tax=Bizionia argentinensis JUB59 TaxID=1046627 RepID=G2ECX1_9FLAO|nr:transcriptional regulator [Bizionia argentinensis]EGV43696.1 MarR family transcriptional regulator [Bizionia argentinensis JUB59]